MALWDCVCKHDVHKQSIPTQKMIFNLFRTPYLPNFFAPSGIEPIIVVFTVICATAPQGPCVSVYT